MSSTPTDDTITLHALDLRFKFTQTASDHAIKEVFGTFGCLLTVTRVHRYYALSSVDLAIQPSVDLSSKSTRIALLDADTEFITTLIHVLNFESGLNIVAVLLPEDIIQTVLSQNKEIFTLDIKQDTLQEHQQVELHKSRHLRGEVVSPLFAIKYGGSKIFRNLFLIQVLHTKRKDFNILNGSLITTTGHSTDNLLGCGLIVGPIKDSTEASNTSSLYTAINLSSNVDILKEVLLQGMTTMGIQRNHTSCDAGGESANKHLSCRQEARDKIEDFSSAFGEDEIDGIGQMSGSSTLLLNHHMRPSMVAATMSPTESDQNLPHVLNTSNRICLSQAYTETNGDIAHSSGILTTDAADNNTLPTADQKFDKNHVVNDPSNKVSVIPMHYYNSTQNGKHSSTENPVEGPFKPTQFSTSKSTAVPRNQDNNDMDGQEKIQPLNLSIDDQLGDNITQGMPTVTSNSHNNQHYANELSGNEAVKSTTGHSDTQQSKEAAEIPQPAAQATSQNGTNQSSCSELHISEMQGSELRREHSSKKTIHIKTQTITDGRYIRSFIIGRGGAKCFLKKMGVCLIVPENALDQDTNIFIGLSKNGKDIPPEGPNGGHMYSPVIVCGPHGLKFHVPVYLVFQHSIFFPGDADQRVPEFYKSETCLLQKCNWMPCNGSVMVSRKHAIAEIDGFTKYVWRSFNSPNGPLGQYYRVLRIMIFKESGTDDSGWLTITVYPVDAEDGEEHYIRASARGELSESGNFLYSEQLSSNLAVMLIPRRHCRLFSQNEREVEFQDIISNRQGLRNHCTFKLMTEQGQPPSFTTVVSQNQGQTSSFEVDFSPQGQLRDSGRFSVEDSEPQDDKNTKGKRVGVTSKILNQEAFPFLSDKEHRSASQEPSDQRTAALSHGNNLPQLCNQPTQVQRQEDVKVLSFTSLKQPIDGNLVTIPDTTKHGNQATLSQASPTQSQASYNSYDQANVKDTLPNTNPKTNDSNVGEGTGDCFFTPRGPPSDIKWVMNDQFQENDQTEQTIVHMVPQVEVSQWMLPYNLREDIIQVLDQNATVRGHLLNYVNAVNQISWTSRSLLYYIEQLCFSRRLELVEFFERHNFTEISMKLKNYM